MFDIIVACKKTDFGIGYENGMAWKCKEELKLFREKTKDSVLIMGRKTVENLPKLKGRQIICVTKHRELNTFFYENDCIVAEGIEQAFKIAEKMGRKVFVAGGAQIYSQCFSKYQDLIDKVHLSFVNTEEKCDTFLDWNMHGWAIEEEDKREEFTHYVMRKSSGEQQYLDLIREVKEKGNLRKGRNGITKSLFTRHLSFNLQEGFPLLTTKKMFTRGIIEELLFFIRGETDSKKLEEKNVNIWKGNTSREFLDNLGMKDRKEGIMGPMYGYQWRYYGASYDEETGKPLEKGIDQIEQVINMIKTDSCSRRILLTDYNPTQAKQGVLYPCHSIIIQFYVQDGFLDMFCYNRSQDLFLGVPFNISSSAFLLSIIAKECDLKPRMLNMTLGDAHIYEEHFSAVDTQLSRIPYTFPSLKIKDKNFEELEVQDFVFSNYRSGARIKAEMIA